VWAVKEVLPNGFAIDRAVSVFETTIRVLGGLLSAHLLAVDGGGHRGGVRLGVDEGGDRRCVTSQTTHTQLLLPSGVEGYEGHLLDLAVDLGSCMHASRV
jgi:hypothetical protein